MATLALLPDAAEGGGRGASVQEQHFRLQLTDGLPVVPVTRARLAWMLTGTDLDPAAVLGRMPPALAECTVAHVAANAVLAGCAPVHLQAVIAAVRAMLSAPFNVHGCHATTMGVTPMLILNVSPARQAAMGLNAAHGALGSGQDNRANATVGRAVKLVLQNCGRAQLGGTESTTIGGPRKFTLCLCENSAALGACTPPWEPFRTTAAGADCVTVHAVSSGLDQLVDKGASARMLVELLASKICNLWAEHVPALLEAVVVVGPEHYKTLHAAGVHSKRRLQELLFEAANASFNVRALPSLPRRALIHKGQDALAHVATAAACLVSLFHRCLNLLAPTWASPHTPLSRALLLALAALAVRRHGRRGAGGVALLAALSLSGALGRLRRIASIPKVVSPEALHVVVSGSNAGKFSAVCPGFGMLSKGPMKLSECVTVAIPPTPAGCAGTQDAPPLRVSSTDPLLDPRGGKTTLPAARRAPRGGVGSLLAPGATVGLLDISKPGGDLLFEKFAALFAQRGCRVRRYTKPTFSRPCPDPLRRRILQDGVSGVVSALAD